MPIVETLESYSRALLPLRAFVRRPFQAVADSLRLHGPRILEMHRQIETALLGTPFALFDNLDTAVGPAGNGGSGSSSTAGSVSTTASASTSGANQGSRTMFSQPSFLNYFTSSYALLMFLVSLFLNRVNAIVAPRHPHPLKLSQHFAIRAPAFYFLIKAVLVTGALLATDNPLLPFEWPEALQTKTSISSALFLCLSAMGVYYITETFVANLQSAGSGEQNFNMVEMSVMFHFTPPGKDVLLVAFIQVFQLLSLQVASFFPRGRHYRLAITSFWGMMDMAHFVRSVYYRSTTYPSMQLFTCIPEALVLLLIAISFFVHGLTYLVTGGNVRRRMFEQRALPSNDEEYSIAVFKLGRACLEATRGMGFWNEVDAIVFPFGTVLDKRRSRGGTRQSTAGASGSSSFSLTSIPTVGLSGRTLTVNFQQSNINPPTGFANEVPDVVEVPGDRQRTSRRQNRLLSIQAFIQSCFHLFLDIFFAIYNKIVPSRYRRRRRVVVRPIATTMSIQDYLNLKVAIEEVMEQVGRSASSEARRDANGNGTFSSMKQRWPLQPEDEERIYSKFLTDKFSEDEEDESDGEFIPPLDAEEDEADSDFDAAWEEHDTSSEQETSSEHSDDLHLYDNNSEEEEGEGDENAPTTPRSALGTLQDFLLDASFLSIFLTGQGRDTPLTRSQHRRTLVDANYDSDTPSDNEEGSAAFQTSDKRPQDITSIRSRRSRLDQRSKNYLQRRPSSRFQNGELLSLLQKYRKTNTLLSTTAGPSGTVSSPSAAEGVSSACSTSTMSPPPMAELPPNPEDSSFYARLLCVVCQAEPRNILLRPCRCLALCNDCRELLAIRRFKQCPCCRSDVQGFSKIYLP